MAVARSRAHLMTHYTLSRRTLPKRGKVPVPEEYHAGPLCKVHMPSFRPLTGLRRPSGHPNWNIVTLT